MYCIVNSRSYIEDHTTGLILFVAFSAISFVLLGLMCHWNFFLVLCISVFARTVNYFWSMVFCKLIVWNIVCSIKFPWFRSNIFTFIYIWGHAYFIIQREPTFTHWRSYGGVYMRLFDWRLCLQGLLSYLYLSNISLFHRSARMIWPVCGLVCCFIFETNNYLRLLVLKKFKLL
jgi:hypothetical protein